MSQVWRRRPLEVEDSGGSGSSVSPPRGALAPEGDSIIINSLNDVPGNASASPGNQKGAFPGTPLPSGPGLGLLMGSEMPALPGPDNVIGFVPHDRLLSLEEQKIFDQGLADKDQVLKWEQERKRQYLNKLLRENNPGLWDVEHWGFIEKWKETAPQVYNLAPYESNPHREEIFRQCYSEISDGFIEILEDGSIRGRKTFLCGEACCLYCDQKRRGRLANEWIEIIQRVVRFNPGFPGLLTLVFTLPESVESFPCHDASVERRLLKSIQKTVRWIFGRGSRSNIFMRLSVHPVGDSDLFRERWHVHCNVIPSEVVDGQFFWLSPRWDWGALDYREIGAFWNSELRRIFDDNLEAIPPECRFVPFCEDDQASFWGKLAHRFKYDMRSFAGDVEKSVIRFNEKDSQAVLKAENSDGIYWRLVDTFDLILRYQSVRGGNLQQVLGWGRCLRKYEMILFGELYQQESDDGELMPEGPVVVSTISAQCIMVLGRYWDPSSKKVKFLRGMVFEYIDPDSQETRYLMDSEMEGVFKGGGA